MLYSDVLNVSIFDKFELIESPNLFNELDWTLQGFKHFEWTRPSEGCYTKEIMFYHSAQPAITRVCRSNRSECLGHFYRSNMFLFHDRENLANLAAWLDEIGPPNRSDLQHLYVLSYRFYKDFERETDLDRMRGPNPWTIHFGKNEGVDFGKIRAGRSFIQRVIVESW